jgi:hypothetical protein
MQTVFSSPPGCINAIFSRYFRTASLTARARPHPQPGSLGRAATPWGFKGGRVLGAV